MSKKIAQIGNLTSLPVEDKASLFENLMNYQQAARFLNVSEAYLRKLKRNNDVPYIKLGRSVRFNSKSLNQWVGKKEIK